MNMTRFEIAKSKLASPLPEEGMHELSFFSDIVAPLRGDHHGKVVVKIPSQLIKKAGDMEYLDDEMPYGKFPTIRVARRVLGKTWYDYSFGIVPGDFYYKFGVLHFDGHLKPLADPCHNILFYADASLKYFAGLNLATTFRFGQSDFYGLIVPLDFFATGHGDIRMIRESLEKGIESSLAS